MIEHISEETFFQWELEKVDSPDRRYPPIVVKKLISLKAQQKEVRSFAHTHKSWRRRSLS